MRLNDVLEEYRADLFDSLSNDYLNDETDEWEYYSSIRLNGIIAVGWFANDDILIINMDGIYVYGIITNGFIQEDYDSSFKKYISNDNLKFNSPFNKETIDLFGIRGGGGNLLTNDNVWKLELINLAWNIKLPRLLNFKKRESYFLRLRQNIYEGYMSLGFSKTENYFMVMGDGGIDLFRKKLTTIAQ